MLSAPLRLTAMTLRGLGPYLHGARLEIKPLTILCGENGSGKSTWLEALRFLKSAAEDNQFPLKVPSESDCFTQHYVIVHKLRKLFAEVADEDTFASFTELSDELKTHFAKYGHEDCPARLSLNEPLLQPGSKI